MRRSRFESVCVRALFAPMTLSHPVPAGTTRSARWTSWSHTFCSGFGLSTVGITRCVGNASPLVVVLVDVSSLLAPPSSSTTASTQAALFCGVYKRQCSVAFDISVLLVPCSTAVPIRAVRVQQTARCRAGSSFQAVRQFVHKHNSGGGNCVRQLLCSHLDVLHCLLRVCAARCPSFTCSCLVVLLVASSRAPSTSLPFVRLPRTAWRG